MRPGSRPTLLALALTAAALSSTAAASSPAQPSAQPPTAAAQPAPPEQVVAVAAGTLDTYVGTYVVSQGLEVRVRREAEGLAVQATGQATWLLQAVSETQFKVRGLQASVTFVHDAAGQVGLLVLDMDGGQTRALRR